MTTLKTGFEGGTVGTTVPNGTGNGGDDWQSWLQDAAVGFTYEDTPSAAIADGARMTKFVMPATATTTWRSWWLTTGTVHVRVYVYLTTRPTVLWDLVQINSGTTTAANRGRLRMNFNGELRLAVGTTGQTSTVGVMPLNTLLRIEASFGLTDGTGSIDVYEGHSTTPLPDLSVSYTGLAWAATTIDSVRFGFPISNVVNWTVYTDAWGVSDTARLGPAVVATPPATEATETWTGANGSPWPAQWSTLSGTTSVQSNRGRMISPGAASGTGRAELTTVSSRDTDATVTWYPQTSNTQRTMLRISGSGTGTDAWAPQNGFQLWMTPNGGNVQTEFVRYVGGVATSLQTPTATTTPWSTSNGASARVQRSGSTVRFKVWPGNTTEPATWNFSTTDSTVIPAGAVALLNVCDVDGVAVTTDWDNLVVTSAAPTPAINDAGEDETLHRVNLVKNPVAAAGAANGWAVDLGGGAGSATLETVTGPAETNITQARRTTWTTAPTLGAGGVYAGTTAANAYEIPVVPGKSYSFGVYGRASKTMNLRGRLIFYTSTGTQIGDGYWSAELEVGPTTWKRFTFRSVQAPALAARCVIGVYAGANAQFAVSDWLEATGALAEESSSYPGYPGPYFDGTYPGATWEGTAHQSASHQHTTVISAASRLGNYAAPNALNYFSNAEVYYRRDAAYRGLLGFRSIASANVNSYIGWLNVPGGTNEIAVRMYMRFASLPTAEQTYLKLLSTGGGTGLINFIINPAGQFRVGSDPAGAIVATGTTSLSPNTWYRVEIAVTNVSATTGTVTIRAYVGDSWVVAASLDASGVNLGTLAMGTVRFGRPAAVAAWTYDFDDIAIRTGSTTFIGPSPAYTGDAAVSVNAGADAALSVGQSFARIAYEFNGNNVRPVRSWTVVSGPASVGVALSDSRTLTWMPTVPGTYVLRYSAANAVGVSTDEITVTVAAAPVKTLLWGNETFERGNGIVSQAQTTATTKFSSVSIGTHSDWENLGRHGGSTTGFFEGTGASAINVGTFTASPIVHFRGYFYMQTLPAASTCFVNFRVGTTPVGELRVDNLGTVALRNSSFAQIHKSQAGVLQTWRWIRIEWMYNNTAATQRVRVYYGENLHGTTPSYDSGDVTTTAAGNADSFSMGTINGATWQYHADNIAVDNTIAGPGPYLGQPLVWESFFRGTPGANYTVASSDDQGDSAISSVNLPSGTITYSALGAGYRGGTCLDMSVTTATGGTNTAFVSGLNTVGLAHKVMFKMDTLPTGTMELVRVINSSSAVVTKLYIANNGAFNAQNAASVALGSSATGVVVANKWYRLEVVAIRGTTTTDGTIRYAIFEGDNNVPIYSNANTATDVGTVNLTQVQIGKITGATATAAHLYWDEAAISYATDNFIGPTTAIPAQDSYGQLVQSHRPAHYYRFSNEMRDWMGGPTMRHNAGANGFGEYAAPLLHADRATGGGSFDTLGRAAVMMPTTPLNGGEPFTQEFSFEFWFSQDTYATGGFPAGIRRIMGHASAEHSSGFDIATWDGQLSYTVDPYMHEVSNGLIWGPKVHADRSVHIVGTYANGVHELWFNGFRVSSGLSPGGVQTNAPWWIGTDNPFWQAYADARFDEVAFYTRKLTEDEITSHYLAGTDAVSEFDQIVQRDDPRVLLRFEGDARNVIGWTRETAFGSPTYPATFIPAAGGTCIELNGTNQYVSFPDVENFDVTGKRITVEAWVRPDVTAGSGWRNIFRKEGCFTLEASNGTPSVNLDTDAGLVSCLAAAPMVAGQVYHIVATYDEQNLRIYVNGVLSATTPTTASLVAAAGPFYVGTWDGASEFWDGRIGRLAVYDRPLNRSEIQQHYQAGMGTYNPTLPYTANFDDDHVKGPWPPEFDPLEGSYRTYPIYTTDSVWTVGRITLGGSYGTAYEVLRNWIEPSVDLDLKCRVLNYALDLTTDEAWNYASVRHDGKFAVDPATGAEETWQLNNGYQLVMYHSNDDVTYSWVEKFANGVKTVITPKASHGAGNTLWDPAATVNMRIQAIGATVKYKLWKNTLAEPATWIATYVDPAPLSAGYASMGFTKHVDGGRNTGVSFDDVVVQAIATQDGSGSASASTSATGDGTANAPASGNASANASATGAGTVVRPVATLAENWQSSFNDTVWWRDAGITVSGGRLQLPVGGTYLFAGTTNLYQLLNSSVYVELSRGWTGATSHEVHFMLDFLLPGAATTNTKAEMAISGANLVAWTSLNGTIQANVSAPYNAVAHRFMRMRNAGDSNIIFETSPDAVVWTTFSTQPLPSAQTTATIVFTGGRWDAGADSTGYVDNVNLPPTVFQGAGSFSVSSNTTGAGTLTVMSDAGAGSIATDAAGDGSAFNPETTVLYSNLTGRFLTDSGDPVEGVVILTPGTRYRVDATNDRIVKLQPREVRLVNGSLLERVPANGGPFGPYWYWRADVIQDGSPVRRTLYFVVPMGAETIDIADCTVG